MTEPLSKVFLILCLFQLKHFICDWVIQTDREVKYKGSYLHPYGILHSVKHSVLTLCILMFFIPSVASVLFALFDGIIHYHIDWVKGMKQLDPECEKVLYDNLWELYDDVEEQIKETDELLKEVDEVLENDGKIK